MSAALRLVVDPLHVRAEELSAAVDVIRSGGVVAYPTDTLYGLAVDPRSADAVRRLFAVKQRPPDRPIPLIAGDLEQVRGIGTLTPLAEKIARQAWPAPLTLVIPASSVLCPDVHLGTGAVAVRVPDSAVAQRFALAAGHALTSTSANLSGNEPASSAEEVASGIGPVIDLLIDGGPAPGGPPSTIVDVTGSEPRLIRAGAVPWDRVLRFLD